MDSVAVSLHVESVAAAIGLPAAVAAAAPAACAAPAGSSGVVVGVTAPAAAAVAACVAAGVAATGGAAAAAAAAGGASAQLRAELEAAQRLWPAPPAVQGTSMLSAQDSMTGLMGGVTGAGIHEAVRDRAGDGRVLAGEDVASTVVDPSSSDEHVRSLIEEGRDLEAGGSAAVPGESSFRSGLHSVVRAPPCGMGYRFAQPAGLPEVALKIEEESGSSVALSAVRSVDAALDRMANDPGVSEDGSRGILPPPEDDVQGRPEALGKECVAAPATPRSEGRSCPYCAKNDMDRDCCGTCFQRLPGAADTAAEARRVHDHGQQLSEGMASASGASPSSGGMGPQARQIEWRLLDSMQTPPEQSTSPGGTLLRSSTQAIEAPVLVTASPCLQAHGRLDTWSSRMSRVAAMLFPSSTSRCDSRAETALLEGPERGVLQPRALSFSPIAAFERPSAEHAVAARCETGGLRENSSACSACMSSPEDLHTQSLAFRAAELFRSLDDGVNSPPEVSMSLSAEPCGSGLLTSGSDPASVGLSGSAPGCGGQEEASVIESQRSDGVVAWTQAWAPGFEHACHREALGGAEFPVAAVQGSRAEESSPWEQPLRNCLRLIWGYESFRDGQLPALHHVLEGDDVIAVWPTGAGKSLLFQLPALLKQSTAVVISPLLSIMADQVRQLEQLRVVAGRLGSDLSRSQECSCLDTLADGSMRVLFLSPERLLGGCWHGAERLRKILQSLYDRRKLAMLAVDEAHVVGRWGAGFRAQYGQLWQLRSRFPETPAVAVTATATPAMVDDLKERMSLRSPKVFQRSVDRANLNLQVMKVASEALWCPYVFTSCPDVVE